MDTFRPAYQAWRGQPFPPGSADDELDDLHADLALADSWVAESVIPYVEDGMRQPAKVDVLAELQSLRHRAEQLEATRSADESELATDYRNYIDLLVAVYRCFADLE